MINTIDYDPFGANLKAGDAEERVPVRVISEPDIRGYASQIISGLEHLHNMQASRSLEPHLDLLFWRSNHCQVFQGSDRP